MIYSDQPEVIQRGAKPYFLGTASMWFPKDREGKYDWSRPSLEVIERRLVPERVKGRDICVNIENFRFHGSTHNAAPGSTVRIFQEVIRKVRELFPEVYVNVYGMCPLRSYYSLRPIVQGRFGRNMHRYEMLTDWRVQTERNMKWFAPLVDSICPSIYFIHNRRDAAGRKLRDPNWTQYAYFNCEMARLGGLPVRPFICNLTKDLIPLDDHEWELQLKWLRDRLDEKAIDGVYVWSRKWPKSHLDLLESVLLRREMTLGTSVRRSLGDLWSVNASAVGVDEVEMSPHCEEE